jgi:methionyl-tRNA formyltransferase
MGTPEFAVTTLKTIVEKGYEVVGVITAPDKPAGRGRKLQQSAVKTYAESLNLKILQPKNLKEEGFVEELRMLKANVQVVVAFRMLPKVVWQMPEFGTFNLHASLLPDYRGAAPINWAVINGEKKTGVTTFFIDEKIDTGEIILKKKVKIGKKDTAGILHDKLMTVGSELVIDTLNLIEVGAAKTKAQPKNKKLKEAPKLSKENCRLDWNDSRRNIYNKVRGLNPYPGAWTILRNGDDELIMKVYGCRKVKGKHDFEMGKIIIEDDKLKIAVKKGYIYIDELQLPGKRKMDVKSLLNGYRFSKEAKVL